jgi:hypothetical protein
MPLPEIVVVTSTVFNPQFKTAFLKGLSDQSLVEGADFKLVPREVNGSYDSAGDEDVHKDLFEFVKNADRATATRLIVAVGGWCPRTQLTRKQRINHFWF